jgi:hypothetical protein
MYFDIHFDHVYDFYLYIDFFLESSNHNSPKKKKVFKLDSFF